MYVCIERDGERGDRKRVNEREKDMYINVISASLFSIIMMIKMYIYISIYCSNQSSTTGVTKAMVCGVVQL